MHLSYRLENGSQSSRHEEMSHSLASHSLLLLHHKLVNIDALHFVDKQIFGTDLTHPAMIFEPDDSITLETFAQLFQLDPSFKTLFFISACEFREINLCIDRFGLKM